MRYIWYTRGWDWGGRFLSDAGLADPLPTFEAAIDGLPDLDETWSGPGIPLALRIIDPKGRQDRSGRPIVHEVAVLDEVPAEIADLPAAREWVWSIIGPRYDELWRTTGSR